MVMVPAVMALLGRAAWWFPAWLGWLPHLDLGEGTDREREPPARNDPEAALGS